MKQQDILAVMKHIVNRQMGNKPDKVFRFKMVSKTRKTRDEELRKPAKYPGDLSAESDVPSVTRRPPAKKSRKLRAKKTAPQDKVGRALQQEMEGLLHFDPPATADNNGVQEASGPMSEAATEHTEEHAQPEPDADPLDIAVQTPVTPNYGGIPNFGPNDPVQYPWPKPAQDGTAMFGRYRLPMTPGPIEPYPAGVPLEDIGVIDPILIGLRAQPVQLPTPRASVTPQLSPLKLCSDSSVPSNLRYELKDDTTIEDNVVPPSQPVTSSPPAETPKAVNMATAPVHRTGARATRSRLTEPAKEPANQPAKGPAKAPPKRGRPAKVAVPVPTASDAGPVLGADLAGPPKPHPRGKAATDLAAAGTTGLTTEAAPVQPLTPARRSADVLAAAEAAQLNLPAKRVRTAKVRST